jgi:hypothetical protein
LLSGCLAGNQLFCQSVVFNPNGSVNFIISQSLNLNRLKTSGVDFESSYSFDEDALGLPGKFGLHMLATYVNEDTSILPGNVVQNTVGQVSQFNRLSGVPKWQGNATITWDMEPWSANLRARYLGAGVFSPTFTTGAGAANTITNNYVGDFVYFDIGGSYNFDAWGLQAQAFGTIQNLFNKAPAFVPSQAAGGTNESSTNTAFYDPIGRLYKVGLRFSTN